MVESCAVVVGIHGQIVVALCGHIAHHQLGSHPLRCSWASRTFSTVSARPSTLWRTCHAAGVILLQNGNAHVGALGRGVKHGGILLAVTVQILQKERRQQLALHGVFELRALPQPVVQGSLHRAVVAGQTRGTQQLFHLHVFTGQGIAARQQQALAPTTEPSCTCRKLSSECFNQHLLPVVENCSPANQQPKITLLSVYHASPTLPSGAVREQVSAQTTLPRDAKKALPH